MSWILNAIVTVAVLYGLVVLLMYFAQTWLLFPTNLAGGQVALPASAERLTVETKDGERLAGIRVPGSGGASEPVIVGFPGNAWNAETMALTLSAIYPRSDVVTFHYRGYGPSTGRPSAEALLADALQVFDETLADSAAPVVAVGVSIGSPVAAYLASRRPLAGLVLVTPFDSLKALASELYWWLPVAPLLQHNLPTIDFVRKSEVPTALLVAGRDAIVPAARSEPLREAIPNLVLDRTLKDAGHNDLYDRPEFEQAMHEALAAIMAAKR